MIIKSKSYKDEKAFEDVIRYVLRESDKEHGFVISRFIKNKEYDPTLLAQEFQQNESYRVHKRKNNVKLYMEILSFRKEDSDTLTNSKLKKFARKYMSLRAKTSVSIATVHRDTEKTHLHIIFSGCEYKTGLSNRISKEDFRDHVKLPMEQFQKTNFPELELSAIQHNPRKKKF